MTGAAHPNATIPDSVELPRIGALRYELGFPTPETSRKLYDEMDFQRAVQAYLWGYPAVSFESIRLTAKHDLGMDVNDLGIADNFVDPNSVWLTANDTTIYAFVNLDVAQGPVVIDIPPGAIVGLLDDFWQRSLADVGLPGPDGDKGGKFLLLPPDYDGEVPSSGYHVLQATMNNHNLLVRGILVNNDVADAVARVRKTKIYPWSERENPKPNKFVSISGKLIDTTPPAGLDYWARLAAVINNNPVQEHDRFFMAMLKPLGIEKGKPFHPDARQTAILEEAADLADAMARNVMYEGTRERRPQAVSRHSLGLGDPREAQPGSRELQPTRRAFAIHLRRDLLVAGHRRHETRSRYELRPDLPGQGRQPLRRRQVLPLARTCESTGCGLLVLVALRQRDPFHAPEPNERRGPLVLRRSRHERGRLARPVFRTPQTGRPREQLARDRSRQRLLPDVPPLQPHCAAVRRHMDAAGCRAHIALAAEAPSHERGCHRNSDQEP